MMASLERRPRSRRTTPERLASPRVAPTIGMPPGSANLASEPGIGLSVWGFFNAHPLVFLLTVIVLVCAALYLVRLLVTHAGKRGEFKIGPGGVYFRGATSKSSLARGCFAELGTHLKPENRVLTPLFRTPSRATNKAVCPVQGICRAKVIMENSCRTQRAYRKGPG